MLVLHTKPLYIITLLWLGFIEAILFFDSRNILQPGGSLSDAQTNFSYEETVKLVSR